jgi:hypothetical protein
MSTVEKGVAHSWHDTVVGVSTYTKLIVYFIIRLIGRANARSPYTNKDEIDWANARSPKGRMPGVPTEEIQPAQAGFALRARYALAQLARSANVCVDAVSTARSS